MQETSTEISRAVRLLLAMAAGDGDDLFHRLDLTWIDDADLLPALDAAIETSARRHAALQAFAEDCRGAIKDSSM